MGRQEVTERTCLLTAGYTETITPDQSSVVWVLKKTGKMKLEKKESEGSEKDDMQKKGKGRKNEAKRVTKSKRISQKEDVRKKKEKEKEKNLQDTLTIAEDETTKWENDIIFEWTKKAQKLVKKEVGNLFREGIAFHGMTFKHLLRGHKASSNNSGITVEQIMSEKPGRTVEQAYKIIIDQAWEVSLEHFLRKNQNQATCEAAYKVHYPPPRNVVVRSRKRSSSEKPPRRILGSEERGKRRSRSSNPSRDVTSYSGQIVYGKAP